MNTAEFPERPRRKTVAGALLRRQACMVLEGERLKSLFIIIAK